MLKAGLLLSVLWWAWSGYAWLTNTLDPEEGSVRLLVLMAIAAMLVMSLAAPRAFGRTGVTFAVAYLVVRALHLLLFAISSREDRGQMVAVLRLVPTGLSAAGLLLAAGFFHGNVQLAMWAAAAAVNYAGPFLGHGEGWHISPAHFVERFGQIIMIALGESVVAIGVGARSLSLGTDVITAAVLGFVIVACLWWSYFDWVVYVAQYRLAEVTGLQRTALARDAFSYLHLPMVAGIVLFAFGLKAALPDATHSLGTIPAVGVVGGIALYLLAHVAVRLRIGGGLGRGRPVAVAVLLVLYPAVRHVSGLGALGLVAAVCVALIAYEVFRHREARALIRSRRSDLSRADVERYEQTHGPEAAPGPA